MELKMPRKSVINQREITENSVLQIRIAKQVMEGDEVISQLWHRTSVFPGENVENVIAAVDAHLTQMGYGPVVDWAGVRATVAAEHTPEVIKAYQDAQAAERAARDAELAIIS
jgi:hypothetical protein